MGLLTWNCCGCCVENAAETLGGSCVAMATGVPVWPSFPVTTFTLNKNNVFIHRFITKHQVRGGEMVVNDQGEKFFTREGMAFKGQCKRFWNFVCFFQNNLNQYHFFLAELENGILTTLMEKFNWKKKCGPELTYLRQACKRDWGEKLCGLVWGHGLVLNGACKNWLTSRLSRFAANVKSLPVRCTCTRCTLRS